MITLDPMPSIPMTSTLGSGTRAGAQARRSRRLPGAICQPPIDNKAGKRGDLEQRNSRGRPNFFRHLTGAGRHFAIEPAP